MITDLRLADHNPVAKVPPATINSHTRLALIRKPEATRHPSATQHSMFDGSRRTGIVTGLDAARRVILRTVDTTSEVTSP